MRPYVVDRIVSPVRRDRRADEAAGPRPGGQAGDGRRGRLDDARRRRARHGHESADLRPARVRQDGHGGDRAHAAWSRPGSSASPAAARTRSRSRSCSSSSAPARRAARPPRRSPGRSCRHCLGARRTPNLYSNGRYRPTHRHALRRALPDLAEARLRRDGERLPRRRPGAREARRDQDPRRPARERRPVHRALPPRGAERRRAVAPEHRLDLRPGRGRGHLLHRDGAHRGADAQGAARLAWPVAARNRDRLHAPDPLGAPLRAPERDRPPRHQAPQRDRRRGGPREGDGLRHRPRRRQPDDRGRLDHRHRAVPLARAGARGARRPDLGPLLDRDRPLRAAHRHRPVHRRDTRRDRDEAPAADAGAAVEPPAGDPARPRLRRPARARQGSGGALPLGRGDGLRPRADRARDRRVGGDRGGGDDRPLAHRDPRRADDDPRPDNGPPSTTYTPGRYYEYDEPPRRRSVWPWLLALLLDRGRRSSAAGSSTSRSRTS